MVDNLVDSNVFMRSLVLSVEHGSCRREDGGSVASQKAAAARRKGKGKREGTEGGGAEQEVPTLLQGFLKQNTAQLVRDLMCVVNLETINHENICCLNTAVLILIFADRRGQL
ncbi:unnamed protein product, partial [Laminaria digitata]